MMTDAQIMEVYKKDQNAGTGLMIEKYHDYIYDFLWKRFPSYMKRNAEDLFQSCVIGILLAMKRYDPEKGAFTTFCTPYLVHEASMQICFISKEKSRYFMGLGKKVNAAMGELNTEGKAITVEAICEKTGLSRNIVERELEVETETADLDNCAELSYELHLMDQFVVEDMFSILTKQDKEVLIMKVFQRMSYKNIGKWLGISDLKAKQSYQRSIETLRQNNACQETKAARPELNGRAAFAVTSDL